MERTIFGRVRVATTWNAWTLGGGQKKGIWVMSWGTVSQNDILPWRVMAGGGGGGEEYGISGAVGFPENS
jgi:hypothetical protein